MPENTSASAKISQQFTLFTQLPYELQINIWKVSIPSPQILRIKIEADETLNDKNYFTRNDFDWETEQVSCLKGLKISAPYSKAPGLLGACKDSRATILSVYKGFLKSKGETVIRFDPENDTIFLVPIKLDDMPRCQCHNLGEAFSVDSSPAHTTRKSMLLGLGTPEIPKSFQKHCRDFRPIFGGIQKLVMVWNEFFCIHSADIAWTLSNFPSVKELTLVTPIRKDAYCSAYLQAVGSPIIWCVEQISSHFASASWLVLGLRNDMTTLKRFKQKLQIRKILFDRDNWELPQIVRFGGCYIDWVEGKS
ncbi:hypothetical protein HI914_02991 [Erysiphe necator]|uniref:2EXR domain-containing protein n=1 Tax=Uncinula necator TaxID=52586 RepID=A0A0B1PBX0_UNCNE|nr:hypothetical protein HI914_02991 [Erysiphe necator]KHJ34164.1 hypothetical protein EV44_g4968 [Erysiphe necator]